MLPLFAAAVDALFAAHQLSVNVATCEYIKIVGKVVVLVNVGACHHLCPCRASVCSHRCSVKPVPLTAAKQAILSTVSAAPRARPFTHAAIAPKPFFSLIQLKGKGKGPYT